MIFGNFFTRLVEFFSESWRQLLAITIAIVLPASLVNLGRTTFWTLLSDTYFEMGVFFLIAAMLGRRWGKWLCHFTFIIAVLDFGLSFGNYLAVGQEVSLHTFYLILGTNPDEASEFFSFYFPISKVLLWIAAIILLCLLYFAKKPRLTLGRKVSQIGTVVFLVTAILCFPSLKRDMYYWFNKTLPIKYLIILKDYEPLDKVAENRHDIPITEVSAEHPQNIVIIIGESFSKSHSSIYGYKKDTNPELAKLADQGNLLAFTQCIAPAPFTHLAFKNIFSLWDGNDKMVNSAKEGMVNGLKKIFMPWTNKDNWYDYPTFFDVFSQKYTIRWVSNQNSYGMFDNVQATFADLSDTIWYAEQHPEAASRYDQVVVPVLDSFLKSDSLPSITIVNLMGQHEDFTNRYPSSWEYFKSEDYKECPAHQQERLAQYDNATRYNDHVVSSIMNLYKDECAMVFYFPDHGLDLYESAPNYIGHAADRSQKSWDISCQIPFFIYVTDSYQETFPQQVEQLRKSLHKPYNTKNFIYTLMKITGWKLSQETDKEDQGLLYD